MKWLRFAVLTAAVYGLVVGAGAAEKPPYQNGKLTDLRRYDTGAGSGRAQGSFCLAIELGDMTYIVREEAFWRSSYEPTDLVVGDPVEVQIRGNDLYIRKPKGGDLKTHISRRERNSPDKKPSNCGLPVSTQN
jgi:hypothetical protein